MLILAFGCLPSFSFCVFCYRYRLMLRRCIESNSPRFGMVLPPRESAAGATEYGTMLEIRSVQMLNDGRSMIETVGSWRFKVLEKGTLDGYSVGRVER
jgi:Lon protease-like protein